VAVAALPVAALPVAALNSGGNRGGARRIRGRGPRGARAAREQQGGEGEGSNYAHGGSVVERMRQDGLPLRRRRPRQREGLQSSRPRRSIRPPSVFEATPQ